MNGGFVAEYPFKDSLDESLCKTDCHAAKVLSGKVLYAPGQINRALDLTDEAHRFTWTRRCFHFIANLSA